ncbi:MAG: hypothetical protein EXR75_02355 [Myxococcales bacterium]|nr:hypothetical protein [Myxococcales bacterium]
MASWYCPRVGRRGRKWARTIVAVIASLGLQGLARSLLASEACQPPSGLSTCLPADNLWPSPRSRFAWLGPSSTEPERSVAFALSLSYLHHPIGLSVASADPEGTTVWAVEDAVYATMGAALGLTQRVHFELNFPFASFQRGAGTSHLTGSNTTLPRSAMGDARFGPTVSVLAQTLNEWDLALASRMLVTAPTGDRTAFVSAGSVTFAPGISGTARRGQFRLAVDAGARLRRHTELGGALIGHQLSLGVGASHPVLPDRWLTVALESFALFTLATQLVEDPAPAALSPRERPSDAPHIPAEWLISAQSNHLLAGRLGLVLGVGGALPIGRASDVTAPALRALLSVAISTTTSPRD